MHKDAGGAVGNGERLETASMPTGERAKIKSATANSRESWVA